MCKQIPSGYKQTKIGIIPEDWELVKLGDIATFLKGNGISKEEITEDGIACIRYGELYTKYQAKINQIYCKTINKNGLVYGYKNDVLIPSSGETAIDIATASCLQIDDVALGGDINIIRTKCNGIFLSYYLNVVSKTKIAALAQGASVIHLYSAHLKILPIALPLLKEQDKIAEILSTWDNAIARQEQLIEQQQVFIKIMMQQIFNQKVRFKDDNGNSFPAWKEKKLSNLCQICKSGGTPTTSNKEYYFGDIPFLSINDMTTQGKYLYYTTNFISELGLNNSAAWIVPEDTLIYSMYASVGFVAINKIKLATSQAVLNLIIKDEYKLDYVYYYLIYIKNKSSKFITTGTQGNVNAQTVKNYDMLIPCTEEQTKIANVLTSIDDEIAKQTEELYQLKRQKKSLMQKLLTGQIRVV